MPSADPLLERLRRFPSPVLRRQVAEAGLDAERFDLKDLPRIAPLGPREIALDRLDDPVGYLRLADAAAPVRLGTCVRDGATIVLTWAGAELARVAETGARALARAGVKPGMKVANTLEGGFATPGSLVLGDAVERLGALDVPVGPVREEKGAAAIRDLLDRIAADFLVVDADTSKTLVPEILRRPPRGWKATLWLGDEPPAAGLPGSVRRWIAVPEVSVFLATECARGASHLDPAVRAEICDGRLVLTALGGDSPLLRYDCRLRLASLGDSCDCGDSALTIRFGAER